MIKKTDLNEIRKVANENPAGLHKALETLVSRAFRRGIERGRIVESENLRIALGEIISRGAGKDMIDGVKALHDEMNAGLKDRRNMPHPLSKSEIHEIASFKDAMEKWGVGTVEEFKLWLSSDIYAAKFDFICGSPGYVGDLFILFPDSLDPPLVLIRDRQKALKILDWNS